MTPARPLPDYAGRSLAFCRTLIGADPKYHTAEHAARHIPLVTDLDPEVGSIVFFGAKPYGHCGVYVGQRYCVTVTLTGLPVLLNVGDANAWGGPLLGWVTGDNFRRVSRHRVRTPQPGE